MSTVLARRGVAALTLCCVIVTACSHTPDPVHLTLLGAGEPGVATVTLFMNGDPRPRAIGNIIAENPSATEASITSVALRDSTNVKLTDSFVVPVPAGDSEGIGVGFPMPPREGDELYDVHAPRWAEREEVVGAAVDPGASAAVVPLIALIDPTSCGRFTGVDIVPGSGPHLAWNTTYVAVPQGLSESDCTQPGSSGRGGS